MRLTRTRNSNRGQGVPEYALILALISLFCLATLTAFGQNMDTFLRGFATQIQRVQNGG